MNSAMLGKRTIVEMQGWNAASMGVRAHQNPYPEVPMLAPGEKPPNNLKAFFKTLSGTHKGEKGAEPYSTEVRGQTNYNLWLNGFRDYQVSPYNCIAQDRYRLFRTTGDRNFFVIQATADESNPDLYVYTDKSAIELCENRITAFGKDGKRFITLELL